eukprot:TRINITY_DN5077_c0_g1_i2.p1 TRINITY_DN5077_c0_g1~~TRINITY_DN5077_c0_g1_i2.p1  ORF type:complete len:2779 (-),score=932.05 TRINITY_DN5077_c0_g1_i2:1157-9493(-)
MVVNTPDQLSVLQNGKPVTPEDSGEVRAHMTKMLQLISEFLNTKVGCKLLARTRCVHMLIPLLFENTYVASSLCDLGVQLLATRICRRLFPQLPKSELDASYAEFIGEDTSGQVLNPDMLLQLVRDIGAADTNMLDHHLYEIDGHNPAASPDGQEIVSKAIECVYLVRHLASNNEWFSVITDFVNTQLAKMNDIVARAEVGTVLQSELDMMFATLSIMGGQLEIARSGARFRVDATKAAKASGRSFPFATLKGTVVDDPYPASGVGVVLDEDVRTAIGKRGGVPEIFVMEADDIIPVAADWPFRLDAPEERVKFSLNDNVFDAISWLLFVEPSQLRPKVEENEVLALLFFKSMQLLRDMINDQVSVDYLLSKNVLGRLTRLASMPIASKGFVDIAGYEGDLGMLSIVKHGIRLGDKLDPTDLMQWIHEDNLGEILTVDASICTALEVSMRSKEVEKEANSSSSQSEDAKTGDSIPSAGEDSTSESAKVVGATDESTSTELTVSVSESEVDQLDLAAAPMVQQSESRWPHKHCCTNATNKTAGAGSSEMYDCRSCNVTVCGVCSVVCHSMHEVVYSDNQLKNISHGECRCADGQGSCRAMPYEYVEFEITELDDPSKLAVGFATQLDLEERIVDENGNKSPPELHRDILSDLDVITDLANQTTGDDISGQIVKTVSEGSAYQIYVDGNVCNGTLEQACRVSISDAKSNEEDAKVSSITEFGSLKVGDRIGIGRNYQNAEIFVTVNGVYVDEVFDDPQCHLYPTVWCYPTIQGEGTKSYPEIKWIREPAQSLFERVKTLPRKPKSIDHIKAGREYRGTFSNKGVLYRVSMHVSSREGKRFRGTLKWGRKCVTDVKGWLSVMEIMEMTEFSYVSGKAIEGFDMELPRSYNMNVFHNEEQGTWLSGSPRGDETEFMELNLAMVENEFAVNMANGGFVEFVTPLLKTGDSLSIELSLNLQSFSHGLGEGTTYHLWSFCNAKGLELFIRIRDGVLEAGSMLTGDSVDEKEWAKTPFVLDDHMGKWIFISAAFIDSRWSLFVDGVHCVTASNASPATLKHLPATESISSMSLGCPYDDVVARTKMLTPDTQDGEGSEASQGSVGLDSHIQFWTGSIDTLRLTNKPTEEVLAASANAKVGLSRNLVGAWNFDEGIGHTLFDMSKADNNGRLVGDCTFCANDHQWDARELWTPQFSEEEMGSDVTQDASGAYIHQRSYYWTTLKFTQPFGGGRYVWDTTLEDLRGGNIMIGLCEESHSRSNYVGGTRNSAGWSYYGCSSGYTYNLGSSKTYGKGVKTGDVITTEFDAGAGSLEFFLNGESMGVAFNNIEHSEPLFGAISFYGGQDKIVIEGSSVGHGGTSTMGTLSLMQETAEERVNRRREIAQMLGYDADLVDFAIGESGLNDEIVSGIVADESEQVQLVGQMGDLFRLLNSQDKVSAMQEQLRVQGKRKVDTSESGESSESGSSSNGNSSAFDATSLQALANVHISNQAYDVVHERPLAKAGDTTQKPKSKKGKKGKEEADTLPVSVYTDQIIDIQKREPISEQNVNAGQYWETVLRTQFSLCSWNLGELYARDIVLRALRMWPQGSKSIDLEDFGGQESFHALVDLFAVCQTALGKQQGMHMGAGFEQESVRFDLEDLMQQPLKVVQSMLVNQDATSNQDQDDSSDDIKNSLVLHSLQHIAWFIDVHTSLGSNAEENTHLKIRTEREALSKPFVTFALWMLELLFSQGSVSQQQHDRIVQTLFALVFSSVGGFVKVRALKLLALIIGGTQQDLDLRPAETLFEFTVGTLKPDRKMKSEKTALKLPDMLTQVMLELHRSVAHYQVRKGMMDEASMVSRIQIPQEITELLRLEELRKLKSTKKSKKAKKGSSSSSSSSSSNSDWDNLFGQPESGSSSSSKSGKRSGKSKELEYRPLTDKETGLLTRSWFQEFMEATEVLECLVEQKRLPIYFLAEVYLLIRANNNPLRFESNHPYARKTETTLIQVPHATHFQVSIDGKSKIARDDCILFTSDAGGVHVLDFYRHNPYREKDQRGKSMYFTNSRVYCHFPVRPSLHIDADSMSTKLELQRDGITILYPDEGTTTNSRTKTIRNAYTDVIPRANSFTWYIQVNSIKANNPGASFGIVREGNQTISGSTMGSNSEEFAVRPDGSGYCEGVTSKNLSKKISSGDIIGFRLDFATDTFSYRHNQGSWKTVASKRFSGYRWRVGISLNSPGDNVTVIAFNNNDLIKKSFVRSGGSSNQFGYVLNVRPKGFTTEATTNILEKHMSELDEFAGNQIEFSSMMDVQLLDCLTQWCKKKDMDPRDVDFALFKPKESDLLPFRTLRTGISINKMQERVLILQQFNRKMQQFLRFIDISTMDVANTLGNLVTKGRGIIMPNAKMDIWNAALTQTQNSKTRQSVTINRHRAFKLVGSQPSERVLENSVFGQIARQLLTVDANTMRCKPSENAWHLKLEGEHAIDAGGVYREGFTQMIQELQSPHINLLIPVPNSKHQVGVNRDKFIPNPSLKSQRYEGFYRFFGKLLGISLRTSYTLELNLPSLFWKSLLKMPVNVSDLEAIDQMCVQCNASIVNIDKKGVTAEVFQNIIEETFSTINSDGVEVPLVAGGTDIAVTFDNRHEFVRLVEETRLHEFDQQVEWIRQGLSTIVPFRLLCLFSWNTVEQRVCGIPDVDLKLLRKITTYRNHQANSKTVKNFWKCLESFTPQERQDFLRFVWGRSRMPLTLEEMDQQQNTRFILASAYRDSDGALPESHTCFFQLDLPNYSTLEIMRERLLYAFTNCRAIDND